MVEPVRGSLFATSPEPVVDLEQSLEVVTPPSRGAAIPPAGTVMRGEPAAAVGVQRSTAAAPARAGTAEHADVVGVGRPMPIPMDSDHLTRTVDADRGAPMLVDGQAKVPLDSPSVIGAAPTTGASAISAAVATAPPVDFETVALVRDVAPSGPPASREADRTPHAFDDRRPAADRSSAAPRGGIVEPTGAIAERVVQAQAPTGRGQRSTVDADRAIDQSPLAAAASAEAGEEPAADRSPRLDGRHTADPADESIAAPIDPERAVRASAIEEASIVESSSASSPSPALMARLEQLAHPDQSTVRTAWTNQPMAAAAPAPTSRALGAERADRAPSAWTRPWSGQQSEASSKTPTIRVTIGRIEVRTTAPAPPPASPPPRPQRPPAAMSLNDYLRRREGPLA